MFLQNEDMFHSDAEFSVATAIEFACEGPAADLRARWRRFLEYCWPVLGPAQRQHLAAHCQAVAMLSAHLSQRGGLGRFFSEEVYLAGLMHDIGKCFIADELLGQPGSLSQRQWRIMNRHSAAGGWLCRRLGADDAVVFMVANHHRPYGAEQGLTMDGRLQLGTHMLTVADAFVTMCSQRSYCAAMSPGEALTELRRCEGSQFDPDVVTLVHEIYRVAA